MTIKTVELGQSKTSRAISGRLSFVDRLIAWVDRLPGPYWLAYLVFFLLQGLFNHIVSWLDGWLPAYALSLMMLLYPLWLWGSLAIITHLNRVMSDALAQFRPLLDKDDPHADQMAREFTAMPPRAVIFSVLIFTVIYFAIIAFIFEQIRTDFGGAAWRWVTLTEGLVSFAVGTIIYYHSMRQLLLVNHTVRQVDHFNLFRLEPVYAFSRVTARTGIALMLMLSLSLLFFPSELASLLTITIMGLQMLLAVAAFVLPLWFVHARLVTEKRRLLAEHNARIETHLERFHRGVDQNQLADMEKLNEAWAGLTAERDLLNSIPTWPWRGGTLRGFLTAIALPIVLYIIQLIIDRWLR